MLSSELLGRLRTGDRPGLKSVDCGALLEAAKVFGIVPNTFVNLGSSPTKHNEVIDVLDRDYPGWRGYRVPETEGKGK